MDRLGSSGFTGSMELLRNTSLVTATIAMGLFAGLFYAFSCAVMVGLRRVDDRSFVAGMQGINVGILNGWFALSFAGAGVLTLAAGALHLDRSALPWIVAGFVLYVAVLVVTFRFSIPLNDALDAAGLPNSPAELAATRERFEDAWVRWNVVRTLASTGALACLAVALRVG